MRSEAPNIRGAHSVDNFTQLTRAPLPRRFTRETRPYFIPASLRSDRRRLTS